jgi:hypothetical protein
MRLFELLGKTGSVFLVIFVWAIALGLGAGTVYQGTRLEAATVKNQLVQSATLASVNITSTPLATEEYQKAASQLLARYPSLVVNASGDSLVVSSKELENYYLWTSAMFDAMGLFPDARWSMKSFCVGESCPGGVAFTAAITAIRKRPAAVEDNLDSIATPQPFGGSSAAPAANPAADAATTPPATP